MTWFCCSMLSVGKIGSDSAGRPNFPTLNIEI